MFIENYIYLISLVLILIAFAIILFFKSKAFYAFIEKNQNIFYLVLGTITLIIAFWYVITFLVFKAYVYLMLGDLCQMLGIISGPILLSRKVKLIKIIAPYMFIGGVMTLALSHPPFLEEGAVLGIMSYLKHVVLFISGILLLNINFYKKEDYQNVLFFALGFFIYILLTSGVAYFVTKEDKYGVWTSSVLYPSYQEITFQTGKLNITANDYVILSQVKMPYPLPTIIFILLSIAIINGAIFGFNKLRNKIG